MKRLLIIAFIFTMTLGFAVKTYSQQILDTPPRNGAYDKKVLLKGILFLIHTLGKLMLCGLKEFGE